MDICFMENRNESGFAWSRFYQQLGFRLKEIKELLDADGPVRKATLQAKVAELEKEDIHLRELIRQAKEHIAAL